MTEPTPYRAWWFDSKKQTLEQAVAEVRRFFGEGPLLVNAADLGDRQIPGVRAHEPNVKPTIREGHIYQREVQ